MSAHLSAPTRFIVAGNGISYAYRRFGSSSIPPLVLLQHYRGNLDSWDPLLVDTLADQREVILVDYPGVSSSTGAPARTVADTARQIIDFVDALELETIDLLGFSLGGFVAQEIALIRPNLIRRLVLAGTGPRGATNIHGWGPDSTDDAWNPNPGGEELLHLFFASTETSQARGREFLSRLIQRTEDRDSTIDLLVRNAQYNAIAEWRIPNNSKLQHLTGITAPTFVIHGDHDRMVPTKASYLLAGFIPDAQIKIYPDAAHAFLFQYPTEVGNDVNAFLRK
jgi:pimeloyl-ACP methyl ester carboxylesterase